VELVAHTSESMLTLVVNPTLAIVVYYCSIFVNLITDSEEDENDSDVLMQQAIQESVQEM